MGRPKINLELVGIYKITNPSGRIYIGYSSNIERRFSQYKRLECKDQPAIYNSLVKYTPENHIFEILELCDFEELCVRERYWQDFYDCIKNGLNCEYTGTEEKPRKLSEESRKKLSEARKGKPGHAKGKIYSEKHAENISLGNIGKKHSEETKKKFSELRKGKVLLRNSSYIGSKKPIVKLDLKGNVIKEYESQMEASIDIGISRGRIYALIKRGGLRKDFILKYKY